jgi:hypothetical protein
LTAACYFGTGTLHPPSHKRIHGNVYNVALGGATQVNFLKSSKLAMFRISRIHIFTDFLEFSRCILTVRHIQQQRSRSKKVRHQRKLQKLQLLQVLNTNDKSYICYKFSMSATTTGTHTSFIASYCLVPSS